MSGETKDLPVYGSVRLYLVAARCSITDARRTGVTNKQRNVRSAIANLRYAQGDLESAIKAIKRDNPDAEWGEK